MGFRTGRRRGRGRVLDRRTRRRGRRQNFDVVVEDGLPKAPTGGADTGRSSGGSSGGGNPDVAAAGAITAEMQGTILSVEVEEGDEIAQGDVVCVLEAMKMENDVVASTGGQSNPSR